MVAKTKRKWRGHPLQDRVDRGEIKLVDHLDIPKDELLRRIADQEPYQQEAIIWAWEKMLKMRQKKTEEVS